MMQQYELTSIISSLIPCPTSMTCQQYNMLRSKSSLTLVVFTSVVVATYTVITTNISYSVRTFTLLRLFSSITIFRSFFFPFSHPFFFPPLHLNSPLINLPTIKQNILNGTITGTRSGALTAGMNVYYNGTPYIVTVGDPYGKSSR